MGDRWTLELLLTAAPWINGNRTAEDRHLSAKIGAVEMVLKGVTAAYDLPLELPAPTLEGVESLGRAYADVGMRAVIAPMVADRTIYEAIPGLMDVLQPGAARGRGEAEAGAVEDQHRRHARRAARLDARPPADRARGRADDPASLLRRVHQRLRQPGQGVRRRPAQPRGRVQGAGHRRAAAVRQDAHRAPRQPRRARTAFHRRARRVARSRRHEASGRSRRLGSPQPRQQHAAGQRLRRT